MFDSYVTSSQLSDLFDALQNNSSGLDALASKSPRIPSILERLVTWLIYVVNKLVLIPSRNILIIKNHVHNLIKWSCKMLPAIKAAKATPKCVDKLKPSSYTNMSEIRRLNSFIIHPNRHRVQPERHRGQ